MINDTTQYLQRAVVQMRDRYSEMKGEPGIVANLEGLMDLLKKIRKGGERSIGFFGGQKRGKSSLINWLLGCDLMPTGAVPMTAAVVMVENDPGLEVGKFKIEIEKESGEMPLPEREMSLAEAQCTLRELVSHAGSGGSNISRLRVKSNFPNSRILAEGGVLVDTPGAECAFEKDGEAAEKGGASSDDELVAEKTNKTDRERAKKALELVKVVVFVERPDCIQSKGSRALYSECIGKKRPICVVNFKDTYELDAKTEARIRKSFPEEQIQTERLDEAKVSSLKAQMVRTFNAAMPRTGCVSCRKRVAEVVGGNPDFKVGSEWKKAKGIEDLESKIADEMKCLGADVGLGTCISELGKILAQIEERDSQMAKEVFSAGLASMCVFVNKLLAVLKKDASYRLLTSAKKMFNEYAPNDRKEFVDEQ